MYLAKRKTTHSIKNWDILNGSLVRGSLLEQLLRAVHTSSRKIGSFIKRGDTTLIPLCHRQSNFEIGYFDRMDVIHRLQLNTTHCGMRDNSAMFLSSVFENLILSCSF